MSALNAYGYPPTAEQPERLIARRLLVAIRKGDPDTYEELAAAVPTCTTMLLDRQGMRPIHYAALYGRPELLSAIMSSESFKENGLSRGTGKLGVVRQIM